MEEKKIELKEKQQLESTKHDIDSGQIFTELQNSYENYATEFLRNDVWNAYRELVRSVPIISFPGKDDIDPKGYLETQDRLYKQALNKEIDDRLFPIHCCYVFYEGGEPARLAFFEHRYKVKYRDPNFDLFFTLKVLQKDIMQLEEFLSYQLNENFENNRTKYTSFLKAVCLKYYELLEKKYTPLIAGFIEQNLEKESQKNEPENTAYGYTLNRQVLFLYYLLKKAGVESKLVVDITEISRIVQGITSRQLGAKDISNTDIYKRLRNPLKDTSGGAFQNDLKFVRDLFEKLSLMDVVAEINKEITDRD